MFTIPHVEHIDPKNFLWSVQTATSLSCVCQRARRKRTIQCSTPHPLHQITGTSELPVSQAEAFHPGSSSPHVLHQEHLQVRVVYVNVGTVLSTEETYQRWRNQGYIMDTKCESVADCGQCKSPVQGSSQTVSHSDSFRR